MNDDIHDKVAKFFSTYPTVRFQTGQLLIFPGDTPDKVFNIVSGRVCEYTVSYRGDEVIVNTFKPPAFFPMSTVINRTPNKFLYKAEAATTVKVAPADDVLRFIKSNPDVTYDLLSRVYSGVDSILERMVYLMAGTARSRLVFELIVEYRRFGSASGSSGYIGVSEASIASRSGLSRETVSREMKHLKDKGLVEVKPHKIHIKNIDELEAQLHSLL